MAKLDAVTTRLLGTPGAFAKRMRRTYPMFFAPSAICVAAAVYFAFTHYWVFVGAFVSSALMYFACMLPLYRLSKKNIEKAITQYEESYQEYRDSTKV